MPAGGVLHDLFELSTKLWQAWPLDIGNTIVYTFLAHSMEPFVGFEWDDNKRRANVAKHDIDFVDATEVSNSPIARPTETRSGTFRSGWRVED